MRMHKVTAFGFLTFVLWTIFGAALVSGLKCHVCNYADTHEPAILYLFRSSADCKHEPSAEFLQEMPPEPTFSLQPKSPSLPSLGLNSHPFQLSSVNSSMLMKKNDSSISASQSKADVQKTYDIWCLTITGKFNEVDVIMRLGAYYDQQQQINKTDTCDLGGDLGLNQILTDPSACFCQTDGCTRDNGAGPSRGLNSAFLITSVLVTTFVYMLRF